jgi:hypothetical protein
VRQKLAPLKQELSSDKTSEAVEIAEYTSAESRQPTCYTGRDQGQGDMDRPVPSGRSLIFSVFQHRRNKVILIQDLATQVHR